MATTTLSQRSNLDHTADDFTVGQRVKAHPATRSCVVMCTGQLSSISFEPKRLVWVKMDRSGKRLRFAARNLASC